MKVSRAIFLSLSFFLITSAVHGQASRPPAPYFDFGACPFECCTYRRWSVEKDTALYKQRAENSGIAFRVNKGDHVVGLTGVVITLKPGKVVVKKPRSIGLINKTRVKAGDVLYLLHYMGEGVYKLWFRGKIYQDEMPTAPGLITKTPIEQREEYLHVVSEPETVWWVKVRDRHGRIGWSKQDDHFGDMDACG